MSLTGAWAWSVKWHFPEAYVLDRLPHPQPSPLWLLRPGLIVVLILCVLTLLSPWWLFSPLLPSSTDFSLGHFSLLVFLQVSFHLRTSTVVYDATSKPVFLTNDPSLIFLTISSWHPGISPWMSLTVLNLINWKPQAPFLLQNQLLFLGSVSFQGVTFHPHSNLGVLLTPSPNCSGLPYVYSAISHIHLLLSCHHSSWGSHF